MASYTPGVKEILRAQGCHFEQRRFPVDGKIVSRHTANAVLREGWYRETILTCPYLQRSCVSIPKIDP